MAQLKHLKSILLGGIFLLSCGTWLFGDGISSRLNVSTQDGTVSNWPYKLKVTNGALADNSDGTMSLATGASLPLPSGDTNYIQNTQILQSGATFYVSSGTVVNQFNLLGTGSESVPAISIGNGNTGFYNGGSQLTLTINGVRRLDLIPQGFGSAQNNDSSGIFFSGQDTNIDSNHGVIHFGNGASGQRYMHVDTVNQWVEVEAPLGLIVDYGATVTTFTVTGSTVILNGVTSSYPSAACAQNQVLVSNGGTSPQLWTCQGQSGSGGGVVGYSGSGVSLASTIYFPIVGGLAPSATESAVDSPAPSGATLANFYAQLSQAVGVGNSVAFTWRKNGSNQSLTCSISGANADSCSDTSHSFTVSQGDTITIQAVPSGIIAVTPNVIMVTQFGTTGSNGTVNNGTANQMAYYAANGTAVSGTSNLTAVGNSIVIGSSVALASGIFVTGNKSVNSSYTAVSTDTVILASSTPAGITITLPAATGTGQNLTITKVDKDSYTVTVLGNGSDLMQGTGTITLNGVRQTVQIQDTDTGNWSPWGHGIDVTPAQIAALGNGGQAGAASAVATSSDTYIYAITVGVPVCINNISVSVGTANGGVDLGIYDANGILIAHTGTTTIGGTNVQTFTLTPTFCMPPGSYYVGVYCNNVTATFFKTGTGATHGAKRYANAGSTSLASSVSLSGGSATAVTVYTILGVAGGSTF